MAKKKPAKKAKEVAPVQLPVPLQFVRLEKGGRPSKYSKALAELICAQLLERDETGLVRSLVDVCAEEGMPAESTVYLWLQTRKEFSELYARARETQTEMNVNDIIRISDTEPCEKRAKVRIDARKWAASKLKPKVYGDKLNIDTPDDGPMGKALTATASLIDQLIAKAAEGGGE
jgi:hypothetical protein